MALSENTEQTISALSRLADLWQTRLDDAGWTSPAESGFPWAQVRMSLSALLPGMREARTWVERVGALSPPAPLRSSLLTLRL